MTLKQDFIDMIDATRRLPGGSALDGLTDALAQSEPSVAIRINRRKNTADALGQPLREVPWAVDGYYVDGERPRFTMDPALHQGRYYVQDPSSMVISRIVRQLTAGADRPLAYLDACAAPGGKTTAAIDALPDGSVVVANEFEPRRADILRENVTKWGYPAVAVTQGDTSRLSKLREAFDIVAVDAPCSGEGMMRKEAAAVEQWSPGLVERCAELQREILENVWPALRPGGHLIYSTCTFNRVEDEENLRFIVEQLGGEPVALDLPADCGIAPAIDSPYPAARFLPGRIDGEGLFIAVVRKKGEPAAEPPAKKEKAPRKAKPAAAVPAAVTSWLHNPDDYTFETRGDSIVAIPAALQQLNGELGRAARVIQVGVEIGTVKGRDIIPTQALALSTALNPAAFPVAPVNYPAAMAYLRGEALRLDETDIPRGIVLLTYGGYPLGFVKNLGNRANNLYPAPWAVRSAHLPDTPPSLLK